MNSWLQSILLLLVIVALIQAHPAGVIVPSEGQTFEKDIIVSPSLTEYIKGTESKKREFHATTSKWEMDGGVVKIPYITRGLDAEIEKDLKLAIHAFKGQTCINFVPRKGETDYIDFSEVDNECSSAIGHQGGRQDIFLSPGCSSFATILHEMMHAIGFLHEQSREDRDDFVTVRYQNIRSDSESQFQKYSLQNFGFPYDKDSLMHYKKHDFSTNGQATIESKADPNEQLGNDYFFTKSDVKQINTLYNCPARFLKLDDYEITIYTSDKWLAGGVETVYLEMKADGLDTSGEFKAGKGLAQGSTTKIEMFLPNISQTLKKLSVRQGGTSSWYSMDGWHLDKVVVEDKSSGTVFTFPCACWIYAGETRFISKE